MELILLILRALALVGGACACYAALFLYENEEKELQNALERWWIQIDDLSKKSLSRHAAFAKVAAQLTEGGLDYWFGRRLLSARFVVVSTAASLISLLLVSSVVLASVDLSGIRTDGSEDIFLWLTFPVLMSTRSASLTAACACVGIFVLVHAVRSERIVFAGTYVAAVTTTLLVSSDFTGARFAALQGMVLVLACAVGIVLDIFSIWLMRWTFRVQVKPGEQRNPYLKALYVFGIAVNVTGWTSIVGLELLETHGRRLMATGLILLLASLTNLPALVVGLMFFAIAYSLLFHRLIWPAVCRPLYRLGRLGLFRNIATRTALFTLGCGSVAVAFGEVHDIAALMRKLFLSA